MCKLTILYRDLAPMGNTNDEASVAERMDIESSHSIPESDSTVRASGWSQQSNDPESGLSQAADSVPAPSSTGQVAKRRRVTSRTDRVRRLRTCRRCAVEGCPGMNNIALCPKPCLVPCIACGQSSGCRGVDRGTKCTVKNTKLRW